MERTVTVSATGSAVAVPDIARLRLGVASDAASARAALALNSETMTKIVAGLKERAIAPADIQTSALTVEPVYGKPREGEAAPIAGYRVRNAVEVAVREISRLGETLDALVTLGVNQIDGLSFEVSQAETLKDEARKEAIANARRRAELFAAAAGAKLGEALAILEDAADQSPRGGFFPRAALSKAVPVERGTEEIEARVTVTWALK
jgi:uncharacterized protein YggE